MKHIRVFNEEKNVLEAARERISYIFDEFEEVQVSISGGKDSTVLYNLVLAEAIKRDRKIEVFFLDQEAEYEATINLVRKQMSHKNVIPRWYQVPVYMTNATSSTDYFLYAWGEKEKWIREKEKISIHSIGEEYPRRFYEIFPYLEKKNTKKAYLIGLRDEESITRYRAVTKTEGYKGLRWTTKTENNAYRFYPIYDWTWSSIWRYIYEYNVEYNKMYDLMFWANHSVYKMRVSNLIHEKAYKSLIDLPKFEPETYDKLCKRVSGIATASRYASEKLVFSNKTLPTHYKNWKEFRDFLLENVKNEEYKQKFLKRFSKQREDEKTYQDQVGQLLISDWENNRSFDTKKFEKMEELKQKWINIL